MTTINAVLPVTVTAITLTKVVNQRAVVAAEPSRDADST